jgi:hypothetical protein
VHAKTDEFMLALMTELGLTEFDTTYDAVEEMAEKSAKNKLKCSKKLRPLFYSLLLVLSLRSGSTSYENR